MKIKLVDLDQRTKQETRDLKKCFNRIIKKNLLYLK